MLGAFLSKFSFNPQGLWVWGLVLIYREVKKKKSPDNGKKSPRSHSKEVTVEIHTELRLWALPTLASSTPGAEQV